MIKKLSIAISCLLLTAGLTFGAGETITFNDNFGTPDSGSYNPTASFSLDVSAVWTGYTAIGLSYWIEVPNALAPFITGTGETYATWSDPNQTFFGSDPFNSASGADAGFMATSRDLGATSIFAGGMFQQVANPGTNLISTLSFALSNAPAGTYQIKTLQLNPKISQISEGTATTTGPSHNFTTQGIYTITVVPEPSTWSLVGIGALGAVGFSILRRRQRA